MDRYLGGEDLDTEMLVDDLETAVARGVVLPRAVRRGDQPAWARTRCSSSSPRASRRRRSTRCRSSRDRTAPRSPPLAGDPDGPLCAEVIKTTTDPYVGRVSLVRVFCGTLRPDLPVHVSGHGLAERGHPDHDVDEKVGALSSPLGKTLRPVAECRGRRHLRGDEARLGGDRGHAVGQGLPAAGGGRGTCRSRCCPWRSTPSPRRTRTSCRPGSAGSSPRTRLCGSSHNAETGQLVLWCMGEAHVDVLLDRLKNKYGVEVEQVPLRVPLRETFAGSAKATGAPRQAVRRARAVRDLPHRGRAAELRGRASSSSTRSSVAPSPGSSSRRWRRACAPRWSKGVAAGYPVVDLRVRWWTARRIRSTPPTWPSRSPGAWRSRRRRRPPQ